MGRVVWTQAVRFRLADYQRGDLAHPWQQLAALVEGVKGVGAQSNTVRACPRLCRLSLAEVFVTKTTTEAEPARSGTPAEGTHPPRSGFLRLWHIIGDPQANPPLPAVIPVSKSTWWDGVKSGRYPHSVKLGPGITAWRAEDIHALIERYK